MEFDQNFEANLIITYIHRSDKNRQNWLNFKHSHPFSEVFYITGGKGSFLVGDTEFKVSEKDVVLIAPYEEHTEISDYETPLEYFVIGIGGVAITEDFTDNIPYFLINDKNRELLYFFYKSYEESTTNLANSEKIIKNLVAILLLTFEREKELTIKKTEMNELNYTMIKVKHYLDMNFKENIDLATLAEKFHISKYYLSHKFKEEYGISPIKYLISIRIEAIKELLISSNYSIIEITSMMGFTSQSYLAQVFSKEVGMSPAQFRKEKRLSKI